MYRAIAIPSVRGYAGRGCASSSATNANSAAAAGYRPSRPVQSSTGRASRPPRSSTQTAASASARHGLSTLQTFPKRIERSGIPSQKITYTKVGREVEELDRRAEERRRERQAEEEDRDRSEHDPHGAREDEPREPGWQHSSARVRLEHRPPPEIEEEDERDGEDDRRADEEVGRRDRKVANDADPVGDDHALTVMSAIGTPRSSSSTSKRPGNRRLERQPGRLARRDVSHDVVAVEVHVVGDIRSHDEDDAVALLDLLAHDAALRGAV